MFTSETDAEVVAHLIADALRRRPRRRPCARAYVELRGHYAFVAMAADEPDLLVGARKECPLVVGVGDDEPLHRLRDPGVPARDPHASSTSNDDEIVGAAPDGVEFIDAAGDAARARDRRRSTGTTSAAEKGGYETFMLKEIHEQADAVAETIADRAAPATASTSATSASSTTSLRDVRRIVIVACGTSYHAGLVGRYAIEEWARVPVEMDIASEYPLPQPGRRRATTSWSASRSPARPRTRWPRCGSRASAARTVLGDHQRHGQPGDARRRRRPLHARRARDRRRRDEDVRRAGGRDVPARRSSSPSCAATLAPRASSRAGAELKRAPAPDRASCSRRVEEPVRDDRRALVRSRASSSTSAGTSGLPVASRAR